MGYFNHAVANCLDVVFLFEVGEQGLDLSDGLDEERGFGGIVIVTEDLTAEGLDNGFVKTGRLGGILGDGSVPGAQEQHHCNDGE